MRTTIAIALWTPVLFVQLAIATWGNARQYSCPANTNNNCTEIQKTGFDWKYTKVGQITEYDQVSLSGYTCVDNFSPGPSGRKRSVQVRSDFNQRCVQGKAYREENNPPKIWCNGENQMSIISMHVSVEIDTILVFHFDMPDGSVCKKTQQCKATGTVVENDQCGGAKSVWVVVHKTERYDCEYGIHKINFDCNPPEGSKPPVTTTTTLTTATKTTTKSTTKETTQTTTRTTTVTTTTKTTGTTENTSKKTTQTTTPSTTVKTTDKTTTRVTATTVTTITTTTTQPPTETTTASTTSNSTQSSSSTTSVAPPPIDVPCPDVLPQCLNTWMPKAPNCMSNSDITCLCPEIEYIAKVQECLSAWSGSENELQGGYSYLAGICAKYVPQNPGICTGVPSDVTLVPNPTPVPQIIVTTVGTVTQTITVTVAVPVTPPSPEQCSTITWTATDNSGVITTGIVTVPQVVFVTVEPTVITTVDGNGQPTVTSNGGSVGLVPFVPASTTPPGSTALPTSHSGFNLTGSPTRTGDRVGNFTGSAINLNANFGLAGLVAVAALLL